MGELIRAKDWSKTALGDPKDWPDSLRTMVAVILDNPFGMYIAWGSEHIQLYNDGYRPILGATKHPQALGISTRETFSEIWHIIGSMFDGVMNGKAVGYPDLMLPLNRNGFVEECYFDFSYSPIRKDNGEVGGVLVTVIETTDKKKAENQLKESEERFRTMAEASDILIAVSDETSNAIYFNKAWVNLTGRPMDDLLNFGWVDLVHPDDKEIFVNFYLNAFKNKVAFTAEFRVLNKNGEYRWLLAQGPPIFRPDGSFAGYISSCMDITDQKNTIRKTEESEQRFRLALAGSNQIVFSQDRNLKHTWIHNPHPEFRVEDIIGKTDEDIHIPSSAAILRSIKQKVLDSGTAFNGDLEIEVNGQKIYYTMHIEATADKGGSINGIIGTSTDITERIKTQQKIEESEERFRKVADSAPVLIWMSDTDKLCYFFNKGWLNFTGRTMEEELGNKWAEGVHPDDLEKCMDIYSSSFDKREDFYMEYRLKRHDGEYRWLSDCGVPRFTSDGEFEGYIGACMDIEEQKNAEEQFRVLADQAPMWVWQTDKEVNVLYANPELLNFIGIPNYTEFIGNIWEQKVHPEDIAVVYQSFGEAVSLQQSFSLEFRVQNSITKQYEWFYLKGVPQWDGSKFVGFIGTAININEQKLVLSEVQYRKTLLEAHNEASLDGILLVDTKGKILSYNHRFVEIWNMPQQIVDVKDDEKALAFALTQLVNPEKFIEKVEWLYKNLDETSTDELELKDGKIIKRYGYHVTGSDGKYYGCSWIFRDITEQRESERMVKESEERFRSLAQTLPQLIWITDAKGNQEFASSKWKEYSGIEPDGEKEWREIVHPEDYDNINAAWTRSLRTGNIYTFNVRLKSKLGEYRWHIVRGEPILDQENKIVKWVGSFTDIHAEKTFTKELEEQVIERTAELTKNNTELENKTIQLEEAQQLAHMGSWEWDVRINKIEWSDELYRIFGLTPKEFKSDYENYLKYIHPDDREYVNSTVQQALKDHQPYNFFHKAACADGEVRILSATGKVITDSVGNVIKISGTAQDVTEQKRKEEELKISEERFYKIFDSNPVAMSLTEIKDNKIKYANNLFYSSFGYTEEEVIGRSSEELNLLDPEEYKRVIDLIFGYLHESRSLAEVQSLSKEETEALLLKLKQSENMKDFEIVYTRKNGETFSALVSFEIIRIGAESYTVTSYQDITERKKAETLLQNQNDQLEKMNKELESFTYISRTFTFAVHKSVSEQIQPDLNTLKFCGDVGLIGLRSKIRRWDAQC